METRAAPLAEGFADGETFTSLREAGSADRLPSEAFDTIYWRRPIPVHAWPSVSFPMVDEVAGMEAFHALRLAIAALPDSLFPLGHPGNPHVQRLVLGWTSRPFKLASPMDESNKPLVTVMMPSFNHGKYVRQAVESIFAETYRPLELVVVDDASSDDSPQILKALQKDAPIPFRLELYEQNQGAPTVLNRCLELARGELISLCASDDMHLPGGMEKLVDLLIGDEKVQVAYGNGWVMEGEDLTENQMHNEASLAFMNAAPKDALKMLQTGSFPMWFQTGISRASMVRAVGGWNAERKADDGPRARRVYRYLAEHDLGHAYCDTPLYIYRKQETNLHKDGEKMREHILDVVEGDYPEEVRSQVLYRMLIRQMRVCSENGGARDAVRMLGHLLEDIDDPKLDAFLHPQLLAFAKDNGEAVRNSESGEWEAGIALHERVLEQKAKIKDQRQRIEKYRAQISEQAAEMRGLRCSASWKIGRIFTKPFRMLRAMADR